MEKTALEDDMHFLFFVRYDVLYFSIYISNLDLFFVVIYDGFTLI